MPTVSESQRDEFTDPRVSVHARMELLRSSSAKHFVKLAKAA